MVRLKDLGQGAAANAALPTVTSVNLRWFGSEPIELACERQADNPDVELICSDREPFLETIETNRPCSPNLDVNQFRASRKLACIARRMSTEFCRRLSPTDSRHRDALKEQALTAGSGGTGITILLQGEQSA